MTLGDLVGTGAHVCGPETTLADAAGAMTGAGHGSLGVVEGGHVIGLITERDLVRAIAEGHEPRAEPVSRWMSADPDLFSPAVDVFDAAEWLLESGYRHLPVVEEGMLLGVVSVTDVLGAVLDALDEEE
jgi:CBS domain-containing protein